VPGADVKLAVNEAVASVIDHAYRGLPPRKAEPSARKRKGEFELEIYCEKR
jgi:anti-sigma regulatory factor (Ser/Thr protein kinase)